jgi:predicted metal-dependent HD superfamily phosphohydrolase
MSHGNFFRASPEEYQKYSENVSREYASDEYQKDRLKMLKTLLTIPFIFTTEQLRERLEKSARVNIQNEIDSIEKVN